MTDEGKADFLKENALLNARAIRDARAQHMAKMSNCIESIDEPPITAENMVQTITEQVKSTVDSTLEAYKARAVTQFDGGHRNTSGGINETSSRKKSLQKKALAQQLT